MPSWNRLATPIGLLAVLSLPLPALADAPAPLPFPAANEARSATGDDSGTARVAVPPSAASRPSPTSGQNPVPLFPADRPSAKRTATDPALLFDAPEPSARLESVVPDLPDPDVPPADVVEELFPTPAPAAGNWTSSFAPPPEPEKTEKPAEKPATPPPEKKEKKWYEKYGLRGYTQFRINETTHHDDSSAPAQHAGDGSIGANESFILRRARIILSGDVSDHLSIYIQPDFAVTPPGSTDANHFVQLRDFYGDVYLDTDKVNRIRVGQSKVPYGWENLQSSSNRVPFDRNDAFNSATRNERDVGVFYYWTPVEAQKLFTRIMDEGLKGTGNYGIFGFGAYNGQGGSFREENDNLHMVARLTWPWEFENGQIVETSVQGFTGEYVVIGAPIRPLGLGAADIIPAGTRQTGEVNGHLDQRIGWTFVYYPQPLGFQAEWTVGQGPALNNAQTAVVERDLQGGYAMLLYKLDECHGTWFPFCRWQFFEGGYRSFRNAPYATVKEWDFGVEWQIRKEMELTLGYTITDRTNLDTISSGAAVSQKSYRKFDGQLLRAQFQINY